MVLHKLQTGAGNVLVKRVSPLNMFRLSRYYSISSLIGIAVLVIILSVFFRHVAMQTLMTHQTRSNVDLANSFANSIWSEFTVFVDESMSVSDKNEPIAKRELERLLAITRKQMQGTNVVKVKIYNLNGLTVFSSDVSQIGKDKSANKGFLQARSGNVVSEITFRNEFYTFEQIIVDRNLIASYIPIREKASGKVTAVFEVYSDVTPLIDNLSKTQNLTTAGVVISLSALYMFLFLIVKHADKIINQQEQQRSEQEDKIRHQAYHDSLTLLPNRVSFLEHIDDAIKRACRHEKTGAIMFLDLDRFKLVNDSLGHDAGDQLLRVTASRIRDSLRETDMVFRMSGDEFIVILEDLDDGNGAALPARRVLESMEQPVSLGDHEVIVNISIGITSFPKKGLTIDELVKEADSAMYSAKITGRNRFKFFSAEMNMVCSERLTMTTELQSAFNNNEFVLYYQPKVDTQSRAFLSVEALLRWRHPEKGIVPPNIFIPILEEIGLINEVGAWVMLEACRQTKSWIDAGLKPLRISVNVSAIQFRDSGFLQIVNDVLQESGLDAQYLELELTESMFIEDTDYSIKMMSDLKSLGILLSIDDFGSGYSSLSYLKHFPVDFLKIDRSFVQDLEKNQKDLAIISAIAGLAHSLNLGIIAEGVEDEHQARLLKEQGCHELQGFLFSRPVPAEELERELLKYNHEKKQALGNS